jgi:acetyltransferase
LRYRFFTALREVSPEQMARLTQIDYEREMAFVAVRQSDQATVGVSRLVREMGTQRGEFAIVVEPDAKGIGLAKHLMDRLIAWAREVGVTQIVGTVLADNHPMIGFVRRLGFVVRHVPDEPDVVEAVLEL